MCVFFLKSSTYIFNINRGYPLKTALIASCNSSRWSRTDHLEPKRMAVTNLQRFCRTSFEECPSLMLEVAIKYSNNSRWEAGAHCPSPNHLEPPPMLRLLHWFPPFGPIALYCFSSIFEPLDLPAMACTGQEPRVSSFGKKAAILPHVSMLRSIVFQKLFWRINDLPVVPQFWSLHFHALLSETAHPQRHVQ